MVGMHLDFGIQLTLSQNINVVFITGDLLEKMATRTVCSPVRRISLADLPPFHHPLGLPRVWVDQMCAVHSPVVEFPGFLGVFGSLHCLMRRYWSYALSRSPLLPAQSDLG